MCMCEREGDEEMGWTIDRQELVLFHAKHKRLRFFYEDASEMLRESRDHPEFARYRRHVQGILATLREVLNRCLGGMGIRLAPLAGQQDKCTLELNLPHGLDKDVFKSYLEHWRQSLNDEGWKEGTLPCRIICEIDKIAADSNSISIERIGEDPLTKPALIHLASSLPILPHWDSWGIFSDNSNRPETLITKIRKCSRPLYAAQLKYNPGIPDATFSKELLGYSARLRAFYLDTDGQVLQPTFTSEEDYYTYCHYPECPERELYRAYGLLVDALNLALHSKTQSGSENDKEKILFYIAYRISTSLGRSHFWHIWLTPDDPNAALEQMWASWWPFHQHILDWPNLHAALATELEQLDIAYVQEAFLHDIIDPKKSIQKDGEKEWLDELVCKYGHILFPTTCFCAGGDKWGYGPYELKGKKITIGKLWDDINKSKNQKECEACEINHSNVLPKFKPAFSEQTPDLHRVLLRRRYRRLVDQQRFFAEQMIGAHIQQTNLRKSEIQKRWPNCGLR